MEGTRGAGVVSVWTVAWSEVWLGFWLRARFDVFASGGRHVLKHLSGATESCCGCSTVGARQTRTLLVDEVAGTLVVLPRRRDLYSRLRTLDGDKADLHLGFPHFVERRTGHPCDLMRDQAPD